MFAEFLSTYAMDIIRVLFYALMGGLGIVLKNIFKQFVTDERIRAIAKTAMMAVEQIYKDLHGRDKLDEALRIAAKLLADKGLAVTFDELEMLIEEAVGEFNAKFHPEKTYAKTPLYEGPQQGGMTEDEYAEAIGNLDFSEE